MTERTELSIPAGAETLPGTLTVPESAAGVVLFAHGSGSSRTSPRNVWVAERLNDSRIATVLFDLLTPEESQDRAKVFDIPLLAERLLAATDHVASLAAAKDLRIGYFGASTGAGAALWAAADRDDQIAAVVSRGGRPDLAAPELGRVTAPTLLIVGGRDAQVIELNRQAQALIRAPTQLRVVPGATHLFEEPGALETVAFTAAAWFVNYLPAQPRETTSRDAS